MALLTMKVDLHRVARRSGFDGFYLAIPTKPKHISYATCMMCILIVLLTAQNEGLQIVLEWTQILARITLLKCNITHVHI